MSFSKLNNGIAIFVPLLCLGLLLWSAATAPAAERVGLHGTSNAGDNNVVATVTVATPPERSCHGRVRHAGLSAPLPTLRTDSTGGGRWQWRVATGVPAGTWHVSVSCQLSADKVVRNTSFRASHGPHPNRKPVRLIAVGSMQAEGWHSEDVSESGGIGGGEEDGYPKGQCTWWAKLMRPDLPVFPGPSGDAERWAESARRANPPLRVGTRAKPGAIVVFQPGQAGAGEHGHVAYVESVHGARMIISEANYLDTPPGHTRPLRWPGRHFQFIYESKTKPLAVGPPPPNTVRSYVFRTCLNGHCGLKRRQGPGTSFPVVGIPLPDGTAVDIACQTRGSRVEGIDATSTNVWDHLADGSYVSDYFVETSGKNDQFTVPIPICSTATVPTSPPPPLSAGLTGPLTGSILTGTISITVESNATAVRFEALYSDTPGQPGTATWHQLGTDNSSTDGFAIAWQTAGVPNQGLGTRDTIQLAAVALTPNGTASSARDTQQVAVANPNSDGSYSYNVENSCDDECVLHRRAGPSYSDFPLVGSTVEGGEVRIACQAHGQPVAGEQGTTDIWDEFMDGSWGSDYYVDTPRGDALSPPIPECATTPTPAPLEVQLTSPAAGATETGTVEIEAASNGPAVRFEAFYSPTPGITGTATWHLLGQDSTPGNGFDVAWNSATVPNQGQPLQNTVQLRASALDYQGDPAGTESTRRVAISNPSEDGTYAYHVAFCEGTECEVNLHSGPGYSSYPVVGHKNKGDEVDIVCQEHGEVVSGNRKTDVWNKLNSGSWISDYFVDTPAAGTFSPPIPECT